MEIEIGIGKTARRGYGFDEVAIVPSRRTRDPDDVDISWDIDAWSFELPLMASAMDAVVSPTTAAQIGRLGGLAVLNLEGLQTRYEDPDPIFEEIAQLPDDKATRRMQELYREPVKDELVAERIREIKEAGVVSAASLTPQRVRKYADLVLRAELDLLVIQGTVVSAEHVSTRTEPLNLKEFIARFEIPVVVWGCARGRPAPPEASWEWGSPRPRPSPTRRRPACSTCTRQAGTCTWWPTEGCGPAETWPRRWPAGPMR